MKKLLLGVFAVAFSISSVNAQAGTFGECMDAWANVFENGDMSKSEAISNVGVGVVSAVASKGAGSSTRAVKNSIKLALVAGAGTVIALAAYDQWDIIGRLTREAQVGAGAALSAAGEALNETGKAVSSGELKDAVVESEPDEKTARILCSNDNRPVLLGHYMQSIINLIDSKTTDLGK